jgi:exonuclease III
VNVIQCYVSTNDHDAESKEQFYNRLQAVLDKLKDIDINILMGDLNAKVGSDVSGYEEVMVQHALGEMNENGEKFADLCGLNNLVIGGSIFAHKRIHKATWVSPDHVTESRTDHLCISKKFRRSLQGVRVRREADAASGHHHLTPRLKLKLKRIKRQKAGRTKYNVNLLKEQTTQSSFTVNLKNKFQVLLELITDTQMPTTFGK